MLVGNTHIQGIFEYSNLYQFEKGDFVIYKNCIYICTAEFPSNPTIGIVSGQIPSANPQNFKVYLGDKISTAEEYFEFISNNSAQEDKYLSAFSLAEILNNYMFGINERGIITEHVIYSNNNGNSLISFSKNLEDILRGNKSNILNSILSASKLNNAVLKISRDLPEVKVIFGEDDESSNSFVLLRQYTYFSSEDSGVSGNYVRVQELVDPVIGMCFYREGSGSGFNKVTEWIGSTYHYDNTKKLLDNLIRYEQSKIEERINLITDMRNNFCYRSLDIVKSNKIILTCDPNSNNTDAVYIPYPEKSFSVINNNSGFVIGNLTTKPSASTTPSLGIGGMIEFIPGSGGGLDEDQVVTNPAFGSIGGLLPGITTPIQPDTSIEKFDSILLSRNSKVVTIIFVVLNASAKKECYSSRSITIDLNDSLYTTGPITNYEIEGAAFTVKRQSDNEIEIALDEGYTGSLISSIYYRQYYE